MKKGTSGLEQFGSPANLILPDASRIFLDRSRRFTSLAEKSRLADWLSFLGRLTFIQHEMLQSYPLCSMPDDACLAYCRENRLPPVPASFGELSGSRPDWHEAVTALVKGLMPDAPAAAREMLNELLSMDHGELDRLAGQVLQLDMIGRYSKYLPIIGAVLQVHWTALTSRLTLEKLAPHAMSGVCPCCGFPPVAGMVRMDGSVPRLRYLHCALCNTEWHLVRVTCAACLDGNHIAYYQIEGSNRGIRAESCDSCHQYLKIIFHEKSPDADPVADDLATLSLDLLVQGADYERMSFNLLFTPSRA